MSEREIPELAKYEACPECRKNVMFRDDESPWKFQPHMRAVEGEPCPGSMIQKPAEPTR
jgi:hypothetical protein